MVGYEILLCHEIVVPVGHVKEFDSLAAPVHAAEIESVKQGCLWTGFRILGKLDVLAVSSIFRNGCPRCSETASEVGVAGDCRDTVIDTVFPSDLEAAQRV